MEQDPNNKLELTILHVVRDMTNEQLAKRVPDIPAMDYRRLTYCLIEDRIAAYKASKIKRTLEYHGFKIRVQRPTSYTWEMNTQIQDANLEYYKKLHGCYETIQADAKELRADLKRTAEKLAKAHPDSESIKHGLTIALMPC